MNSTITCNYHYSSLCRCLVSSRVLVACHFLSYFTSIIHTVSSFISKNMFDRRTSAIWFDQLRQRLCIPVDEFIFRDLPPVCALCNSQGTTSIIHDVLEKVMIKMSRASESGKYSKCQIGSRKKLAAILLIFVPLDDEEAAAEGPVARVSCPHGRVF